MFRLTVFFSGMVVHICFFIDALSVSLSSLLKKRQSMSVFSLLWLCWLLLIVQT